MNINFVEIVGAVSGSLAVAGAVMNNRKMRVCFVVWAISNSLSVLVHVAYGTWSLAARDVVFLGLAVHGFILWRKK